MIELYFVVDKVKPQSRTFIRGVDFFSLGVDCPEALLSKVHGLEFVRKACLKLGMGSNC